jgi:redox-regulated HSP33 family molecular chaperone
MSLQVLAGPAKAAVSHSTNGIAYIDYCESTSHAQQAVERTLFRKLHVEKRYRLYERKMLYAKCSRSPAVGTAFFSSRTM